MKRVLLIKYGEIALRKGNRGLFERRLVETLRGLIADDGIRVTREQGRFLVERVDDRHGGDVEPAVIERIRRVFGITAICPGVKTTTDMDALKAAALIAADEAHSRQSPQSPIKTATFKIETRRGDKAYPLQSPEISAAIGEHLLLARPAWTVDVHRPDVTVFVEVRLAGYAYTQSVVCEGGLPYGASGKGMLLLSGGIDSPIAGYLMARRGTEIVPVYFHAPPHTTERALEKVKSLVRVLAGYTGPLPLYVVPFTEIQEYMYARLQEAKLTLFFKRGMLRIASALAARENADCLITGDSVGQVASQTIQSIRAIDSATELPILRPLAAMDKQQIIDIARTVGTFDISIQPYDDCCTVFVPKHPESRPNPAVVAKIESNDPTLPALYAKAVAEAVRISV